MYPRFNSICLAYQRKQLQQHSRNISYAPPLSIKVFTKSESLQWEYSAQKLFLFLAMLNVSEPSTSPSRITSSPSHSPAPSTEHSPDHTTAAVSFPSPTQPTQPSPETEQHIPTPHDSPLHVVYSHGSDEGSVKLIELTNLVTKLSERIGILEDDLKKTKLTYSAAVTKLILRGMKSDVEVQGKASTETEPIIQEVTPTEVIQDQGSSEKGNSEVSTAGATKGTASEVLVVSTAEENISTAGRTVTYRRRSEEERTRKDKGKAIMTEPEPKEESKQRLNKKGDGSSKNYKILSEMLEDFDRQDVMTYTDIQSVDFAYTLISNKVSSIVILDSSKLHVLDELRLQAYENSKLYKARTKAYHDKKLRVRKEFKVGDKVLLYNSKYKFKAPKLRLKWYGPFIVKHGYPSEYVELYDKHGGSFIVNGYHVKLYHDEEQLNELTIEEILLMCEEASMKSIPFMALFPANYRETVP
ncbi:hypothetical protein Tco_0230811 [Tanacetum coccineum]